MFVTGLVSISQVQNNVAAVKSFGERYGDHVTSYVCFAGTNDWSYVVVHVLTRATVIHCLFWLLLALVCLVCKCLFA